ncbi:hypothetical protein BDN70DRAFT_987937 [Pholiota conissans]|uniref:Uncharacterized protein n=1 Tax=Pholiota conissans TaxID=109636 RepID=A0A9P5ZGS3_9AGAR|nr:hypothetical protein BDN70DRAFT_987937 [Pholiota conissans]
MDPYYSAYPCADSAYDLPDLYYDHHDLPSPPSATSSNIISTPPLDWQQPWLSDEVSYQQQQQQQQQQPPWQSSPLVAARPMVHPIDTECNWIYQQQHSGALEPSSILFSSYKQPHHASSSLSLSSTIHSSQARQTQTHASGFISSSGAALPSSSPLSAPTTVSPSALTLYPSAAVSPPYQGTSASTTSLKLHQPRPSRKIPIVSLSELATASPSPRSIYLLKLQSHIIQWRIIQVINTSPTVYIQKATYTAPPSHPERQITRAEYHSVLAVA